MGRPQKLSVTEANATNVAEVVTRTLKKVRSFTIPEITELVKSAYKVDENSSTVTLTTLVNEAITSLVSSGKVTNDQGNYKVVVAPRGRPKKVVEVAAAAQ